MSPATLARVCEACGCWPCRCRREPIVSSYSEPDIRVERCSCGGHITVYEPTTRNIRAAIVAHHRTVGHACWRRGFES